MTDTMVKHSLVQRHLQGWQAGLIALALAGLGMMLGVPRPVAPTELPLPEPALKPLHAVWISDMQRAASLLSMDEANRGRYGFDLRRVGDWFHRYGEAESKQDRDALAQARQELLAAIKVVRDRDGDEPLLALRSYELLSFLNELESWEGSAKDTDRLHGVGGDFIALALQNSWIRAPHRLLLDQAARAALFKLRFNELTALRKAPYALTLDETRALYRFLLRYPVMVIGVGAGEDSMAQKQAEWSWLLRKVEELGAVDSAYPLELARGVVAYQRGDMQAAEHAFRTHLTEHPDGPYTLRVRNYHRAALKFLER